MGEPVHLIHKYSVDEAKVAAVKKRVTGGTELMYCSGVERIAIDDSGLRGWLTVGPSWLQVSQVGDQERYGTSGH
jgi:hypothetical protein